MGFNCPPVLLELKSSNKRIYNQDTILRYAASAHVKSELIFNPKKNDDIRFDVSSLVMTSIDVIIRIISSYFPLIDIGLLHRDSGWSDKIESYIKFNCFTSFKRSPKI